MKTPLHYLVAARHSEIAELEQLAGSCTLVGRMAELIHALQKERGLSSMRLASAGAQGGQQLARQNQEVDEAAGRVLRHLQALVPADYGARLFNAIAYTLQGMQALPALRARIAEGALSPEECTAAYMRLIAGCLTVVFEAADSACDPDISRMLVAMFHFMQGKELAGQERATGVVAFAGGLCQQARQRHWLHLIESQDRCFQVFADFAPEAVAARWQQQSGGSADMAVIERLRRIACTAAGNVLEASLNALWFEACTSRLDAMHEVEAVLAQELQALCLRKLAAARQTLAQQQALLLDEQGRLADDAPGDMHFFSAPAPQVDWPLEASCGPQLGRSILSLVQEQTQRLQLMQAEIDKARATLKERTTIERAKGVLMNYRQLSESEAYKLIRQTAMNQNRRMLDVAEAILATVDVLVH